MKKETPMYSEAYTQKTFSWSMLKLATHGPVTVVVQNKHTFMKTLPYLPTAVNTNSNKRTPSSV